MVAHEIGHNIGLHHDSSWWHVDKGCNGEGIMSSRDGQRPLKWSECSKKDLKAYYNHATKVQGLTWCMEGKYGVNNQLGVLK